MSALSTVVAERAEQIAEALRTVPGSQTYTDPGATIQTPGIVLGPPALVWETGGPNPTGARFLVYAVVDANEQAVAKLLDFAVEVAAVIDERTDAVVIVASPATFVSGTVSLPCYELTVEAPL